MSRFGASRGFSFVDTREAFTGPKVQFYVGPGCHPGRNAPNADRAEGPTLNIDCPTGDANNLSHKLD